MSQTFVSPTWANTGAIRRSVGLLLASLVFALTNNSEASDTEKYDLVADRNARIQLAKTELGPKTKTTIVEDIFVVMGDAGGVPLLENVLAAYFNGRFDKRPDQAISVYLFPDRRSYESYCRKQLGEPCISSYGFYRPDLRRIVMNAGPGLGTLTHEIVHPIIETDFPAAPIWLNEGIASLFEAPVVPHAGEVHGRKNWRYPRLITALANPKEKAKVRPARLFGMTDDDFRGADEDLNYALARYFCQWLDSENKLWPFYHAFREDFVSDPTGAKAFASVMGGEPDTATASWMAWLKRL